MNIDVEPAKNTINWIVPGFREGSGGHINIFRFVRHLESMGYECRIVMPPFDGITNTHELKRRICRNFGDIKGEVFFNVETAPDSYACVATGWGTAYAAKRLINARKNFYFIQDFEPWFYPAGSQASLAEATYRWGWIGITAGDWLAHKLHDEYGMETFPLRFSYDPAMYSAAGRPTDSRKVKRVFFYARAETERRGFELGMMALRALTASVPNVQVVLAGMNASRYEIGFPHQSLGVLRVDQLAEVYRSCDVALVLSMTNASLLPLEIMACGTPIVSNRGPWVEWLLAPGDALLADATVEALSDAMQTVLTDDGVWQRLHVNGLKRAQATSWSTECDRLVELLTKHGCTVN